MKQPRWKKWLSYLTDVHIESSGSDYNPELHVLLSKGRYQLCTNEAIYSFGDKYDNFGSVFNQIDLPSDHHPVDVLILGFGLGSIPILLEHIHQKKYQYIGVEIDEEIIYLASKYVLDELESDIQLIQADANLFVQINESKYDIIAMDVFDSDKIPQIFQEEEFLLNVSASLSEQGLLIYNRLYQTDEDKKEADSYFNAVFNKVFPNARKILNDGNLMLLNK